MEINHKLLYLLESFYHIDVQEFWNEFNSRILDARGLVLRDIELSYMYVGNCYITTDGYIYNPRSPSGAIKKLYTVNPNNYLCRLVNTQDKLDILDTLTSVSVDKLSRIIDVNIARNVQKLSFDLTTFNNSIIIYSDVFLMVNNRRNIYLNAPSILVDTLSCDPEIYDRGLKLLELGFTRDEVIAIDFYRTYLA